MLVSLYVVDATASDGDLLNLDNLELAKTSIIYAQNHDTGEWEDYAQLSRTNHRSWVNLDQIPDDMKWAVICLEDKDFYTEPGVNFKRTASVTLNLVLTKLTGGKLSLYSSLQGASTLEQQLIKTILTVKKRLNRKLAIEGILLTMVDFRTNYARDIATRVHTNYGSQIEVFENVIPMSVKAAETSAE